MYYKIYCGNIIDTYSQILFSSFIGAQVDRWGLIFSMNSLLKDADTNHFSGSFSQSGN